MNKSEFYNSVVNVYNATGQGVPGFLRGRAVSDRDLDSLIAEGLLKVVTIHFSHLPDDETICLTRGYCVEEEITRKDTAVLSYVRFYKGIPQGMEDIGGPNNEMLSKDPGWMKGYNEWLAKNSEKLKEKIEPIIPTSKSEFLNEAEKKLLTSRESFKKNLTVRECLVVVRDYLATCNKLVKTYTELISLTKGDKKYEEKNREYKISLEKEKKEIEIRTRIEDFMQMCPDLDMPIKDYYNSHFSD